MSREREHKDEVDDGDGGDNGGHDDQQVKDDDGGGKGGTGDGSDGESQSGWGSKPKDDGGDGDSDDGKKKKYESDDGKKRRYDSEDGKKRVHEGTSSEYYLYNSQKRRYEGGGNKRSGSIEDDKSRGGYGRAHGDHDRKRDANGGQRYGRDNSAQRRYEPNRNGGGGVGMRDRVWVGGRSGGYVSMPYRPFDNRARNDVGGFTAGRGSHIQTGTTNSGGRGYAYQNQGNRGGMNSAQSKAGYKERDELNTRPSTRDIFELAGKAERERKGRSFVENVKAKTTSLGYNKAVVEKAFPNYLSMAGSSKSATKLRDYLNNSPTTGYFQYQEEAMAMSLAVKERSGPFKTRYQPSTAVNEVCLKVMRPNTYGGKGDDLPVITKFQKRTQPAAITQKAEEYFNTLKAPVLQVGNDDGGDGDSSDKSKLGVSAMDEGQVLESPWTVALRINQNPPMPVSLTEEAAFKYMMYVKAHDVTGLLRGEISQSEFLLNDVVIEQRQRQNMCVMAACDYKPMVLSATDSVCWAEFLGTGARNPSACLNELMSKHTLRSLVTAYCVISHAIDYLGEFGLLVGTELVTMNTSASPNKLQSAAVVEGIYRQEPLKAEQLSMKICVGAMEQVKSQYTGKKSWVMNEAQRWSVLEERDVINLNKGRTPQADAPFGVAFDSVQGGMSAPLQLASTLKWEEMVTADNVVMKTPIMLRIIKQMDVGKSLTVDQNKVVVFVAFAYIMQEMSDNGELDYNLKSHSSRYVPSLLMEGTMVEEFVNEAKGTEMAANVTQLSVMSKLYSVPNSDMGYRAVLQWLSVMLYTRGARWVKVVKLRVKKILEVLAAQTEDVTRVRIVEGAVLFVFTNGKQLSYTEWNEDMRRRNGMSRGMSGQTTDYVTKQEMDELVESGKTPGAKSAKAIPAKVSKSDRKKGRTTYLEEMGQVEVNNDCVKHFVKCDKEQGKWNKDCARRMSSEENMRCAQKMYELYEASTGETEQKDVEEVIKGVAKAFNVSQHFNMKKVNGALKEHGNEKQLIEYIRGEEVTLPLLSSDEMMGKAVPDLLQMTNIVKSSLFLEVGPINDVKFRGLSQKEVIVQVLLSLCPKVVNATPELTPNFKGAMSILGAHCALLLRGTTEQLRVMAAANLSLGCVAGMYQMKGENGKVQMLMDPRFGVMNMDDELTDEHNIVTKYRGTMLKQNSVEAELLEMRLPANSVIRAAGMMRKAKVGEETDALCGALWLTGVQGYNINGVQLDRGFIKRFLEHCYNIRQKAAAVNENVRKEERYADVICELGALKEMMRVVAVHSQFVYLNGVMLNGPEEMNSQSGLKDALKVVMKSDVQWTDNRVWGVNQDKKSRKLKRPRDQFGVEFEAAGAKDVEMSLWKKTSDLAELYKGDLLSEIKGSIDQVMKSLSERNIDNAIALNHVLKECKTMRMPGNVTDVAKHIASLIDHVRNHAGQVIMEYKAEMRAGMPKPSKHELKKHDTDMEVYRNHRFTRLVAAVAPVFEMAAGISPVYVVDYVMMKLIIKYSAIMTTTGLDEELSTALSHSDKVTGGHYVMEGDKTKDEWPEWELYRNIPEVVMYLENDLPSRKREVKDRCAEKLDKMTTASEMSDQAKSDKKDEDDDDMGQEDKLKVLRVDTSTGNSGNEVGSIGLPSIEGKSGDMVVDDSENVLDYTGDPCSTTGSVTQTLEGKKDDVELMDEEGVPCKEATSAVKAKKGSKAVNGGGKGANAKKTTHKDQGSAQGPHGTIRTIPEQRCVVGGND